MRHDDAFLAARSTRIRVILQHLVDEAWAFVGVVVDGDQSVALRGGDGRLGADRQQTQHGGSNDEERSHLPGDSEPVRGFLFLGNGDQVLHR